VTDLHLGVSTTVQLKKPKSLLTQLSKGTIDDREPELSKETFDDLENKLSKSVICYWLMGIRRHHTVPHKKMILNFRKHNYDHPLSVKLAID